MIIEVLASRIGIADCGDAQISGEGMTLTRLPKYMICNTRFITIVTVSAKPQLICTNIIKLSMLQRKIHKFSLGHFSEKEDSNQFKLYTIFFACSWRVRKSLLRFSSPCGVCVKCVCLQCGKHKPNCHHFFN